MAQARVWCTTSPSWRRVGASWGCLVLFIRTFSEEIRTSSDGTRHPIPCPRTRHVNATRRMAVAIDAHCHRGRTSIGKRRRAYVVSVVDTCAVRRALMRVWSDEPPCVSSSDAEPYTSDHGQMRRVGLHLAHEVGVCVLHHISIAAKRRSLIGMLGRIHTCLLKKVVRQANVVLLS